MRVLVFSIVALVLLGTIASNVHAYKSYANHQLWRLRVTNNEQVAKMLDFSNMAHLHDINFWSEEFRINVPVSLVFITDKKESFFFCYLIRLMFVYHPQLLKVLLNIYHQRVIKLNMMLL